MGLVYGQLRMFQFEPNLNNLNDHETFVLLFSTAEICFYTAKTCFNILTVKRKMLYNIDMQM